MLYDIVVESISNIDEGITIIINLKYFKLWNGNFKFLNILSQIQSNFKITMLYFSRILVQIFCEIFLSNILWFIVAFGNLKWKLETRDFWLAD